MAGKLLFLSILILISVVYLVVPKEKPFLVSSNLTSNFAQVKQPEFIPKTPTLEQIFTEDHSWVNNLPTSKIITLLATGDIIPARSVNHQTVTRNDFTWPYKYIADTLKSADVTFANLESPLIKNCPVTTEGMRFCGDARNIEGLKFAGIDIVNTANNHFGNYGINGIDETVNSLDKNGILVTGKPGPAFKTVKGIKFAFLGYNDIGYKEKGISWAEDELIKNEISDAKKRADVVIVTFHWGTEYISTPNERQRYLAYLAIDYGADLIIGNHPHWVQAVEIYKGKVISYAHGNFVFDQEWSQKTKEGVVGRYTFYENNLIDVEFLPIEIFDYGQPKFLDGLEKQRIIEEMKSIAS